MSSSTAYSSTNSPPNYELAYVEAMWQRAASKGIAKQVVSVELSGSHPNSSFVFHNFILLESTFV